MDVHSAWQAWHLRHLVARLVPSGRRGRRGCLCGRRGTWRHLPSLCVASVALTGSGGALGSQWTPRSPWMFAWLAWHLATSAFTLRGRRGTWRHRPSLCAASVALTASGGTGRRGCLRGKRGTWRHLPSLCVGLAWQAWHLATSTSTLRGKRGTYGTGLALVACSVPGGRVARVALLGWLWWRACFPVNAAVAAPVCVAGVALGDICLHFAWQAWHLVTSAFTLRGRRGTWRHGPPLCMAGVTIMAPGGALGSQWTPPWQAWHLATSAFTLRGRHGTWRHGRPRCVAGVVLGDIDLQFEWQAWHLATST